jgi:monoamine oxidase
MLSGGTDDVEVVVVGAGSAGLGAAMRLAAARVSLTVLEARGRVGGRACTVADSPFPLDLGCGWLYSAERNLWTRIAAEAGFTIDKTVPAWGTQSFGLAVAPNDTDFAASELLETQCRFNPLLERRKPTMFAGSGSEMAWNPGLKNGALTPKVL